MAHCQYRDEALVNPVTNHIAAVAKINDPVTEFIFHVFNWAPLPRLLLQHFDTLADISMTVKIDYIVEAY